MRSIPIKLSLSILIAVLMLGFRISGVFAEESPSVLYVPLIGITSVPVPISLPGGPGNVTYNYAVKNFLTEYPLSDVLVTDDKCSPAKYTEGDDNNDGKLDYSETWRYTCTTKLVETTQSIATAIGTANNLPAAHKAYTTVVVGSKNSAPLVSIINITKVAYPLTLPAEGGDITFTYRVNNPGVVPLGSVSVTDDKCANMSGKLGDTNGNSLLDITEVWVYTCKTHITETTTNTVSVEASANGLKAVGYATITVTVAAADVSVLPNQPSLPNTGPSPNAKISIWSILIGVLVAFVLTELLRERKPRRSKKKSSSLLNLVLVVVFLTGTAGAVGYSILFIQVDKSGNTVADNAFGWKFPVPRLPTVGAKDEIAYSSIRDPGGIPLGLPVRLQVPVIGVDSAIEDALITPDGRMDVPAGSVNVAWFALGPHPGQVGSAVIGGHFGINNGHKFVFYDLDKLKTGDKAYIVDDKGRTLAFQVRDIILFDRNADATTVFTSNDGKAHLNLITCEGTWNQVNGAYPQRRVVFMDSIPDEGLAPITTPLPSATPVPVAITRTLKVGSQGADVASLQTNLVIKGFLKMPATVAKGYFGSLTRIAVAKYQTSRGLTASGVFDTATKAKFSADLAVIEPGLPVAAIPPVIPIVTPKPAATPTPAPLVVQAAASLYETPMDGIITSVLILAVILMAIKVLLL